MNELLSFHEIFEIDSQQDDENVIEDGSSLNEDERLHLYFQESVLNFDHEKTNLPAAMSDKELSYVKTHSIISAVDISYHLLSKFTPLTEEEQIYTFVNCLRYLAAKRVPKEYMGGFAILMVKYHYLP